MSQILTKKSQEKDVSNCKARAPHSKLANYIRVRFGRKGDFGLDEGFFSWRLRWFL